MSFDKLSASSGLLFALVVVQFFNVSLCAASEKSPLNVLFIVIDDLRPELGCYGSSAIQTPHMDRLAYQGSLFENAYCQVPVCGASRASFMTGLYPTAERFVRYYARADEDAPGVVDIPKWFQQNGYTTISNGKVYHHKEDNADSWDEIHRPNDFRVYLLPENQGLGFKEQVAWEGADVGDDDYPSGQLANKVIEDLKRAKAEGTPFFITAGFTKPHLPFNAPKKYWDLYDEESIQLADNPYKPVGAPRQAMHGFHELRGYGNIPDEGPISEETARSLIHGYYASTSYTDALVGRLLNALADLEMDSNTIVLLIGDHGWQLGEHALWCKHSLFKTSLHTPMIIRAPGLKGNQRVDSIVEFVDIYPTLCELSGLESPSHLQGRSIMPLLSGASGFVKKAAFGRYHGGESVKMERYQYSEWGDEARMLYDQKTDPSENTNISENPENQAIIRLMRERLHTHRESL
ncbi:MAG: sulfatase [Coraliomargaritaceae bacterium]